MTLSHALTANSPRIQLHSSAQPTRICIDVPQQGAFWSASCSREASPFVVLVEDLTQIEKNIYMQWPAVDDYLQLMTP